MLPLRNTSNPHTTPARRSSHLSGHSLLTIGTSLYLFGGHTENGFSNEVYRLQPLAVDLSWQRVRVSGDTPRPCADHAAISCGTDMYCVGGMGEGQLSNDVHIFDTEEARWRQVMPSGLPFTALEAAEEVRGMFLLLLSPPWDPFRGSKKTCTCMCAHAPSSHPRLWSSMAFWNCADSHGCRGCLAMVPSRRQIAVPLIAFLLRAEIVFPGDCRTHLRKAEEYCTFCC